MKKFKFSKTKLHSISLMLVFVMSLSVVLFACGDKKDDELNKPSQKTIEAIQLPNIESKQQEKTEIINGSFYDYKKPGNNDKLPLVPNSWSLNSKNEEEFIGGVVALDQEFISKNKVTGLNYNDSFKESKDGRALLMHNIKNEHKYSTDNYKVPSRFQYFKLVVKYMKLSNENNESTFNIKIKTPNDSTIAINIKSKELKQNKWNETFIYFENGKDLDENTLSNISISTNGNITMLVDKVDIIESTKDEYANAKDKYSFFLPNPNFNQNLKNEFTNDGSISAGETNKGIKEFENFKIVDKDFNFALNDKELKENQNFSSENKFNAYVFTSKIETTKTGDTISISKQDHDGFVQYLDLKKSLIIEPNKKYKVSVYVYSNDTLQRSPIQIALYGFNKLDELTDVVQSETPIEKDKWVKYEATVKGNNIYPLKATITLLADIKKNTTMSFVAFANINIESTDDTSSAPNKFTKNYTMLDKSVSGIDQYSQEFDKNTGLDKTKTLFEEENKSIYGKDVKIHTLKNEVASSNKMVSTNTIKFEPNEYYMVKFYIASDLTNSEATISFENKNDKISTKIQDIKVKNLENNKLIDGFKSYTYYFKADKKETAEYQVKVQLGLGSRVNPEKLVKGFISISDIDVYKISELECTKKIGKLFSETKTITLSNINTNFVNVNEYDLNKTYDAFINYPKLFKSTESGEYKPIELDCFLSSQWQMNIKNNEPNTLPGKFAKDIKDSNAHEIDSIWKDAEGKESPKVLYKYIKDQELPRIIKDRSYSDEAISKIKSSIINTNTVILGKNQSIKTTRIFKADNYYEFVINAVTDMDTAEILINNSTDKIKLTKTDFSVKDNIKYTKFKGYLHTKPIFNQEVEILINAGNADGLLFVNEISLNNISKMKYLKAIKRYPGFTENTTCIKNNFLVSSKTDLIPMTAGIKKDVDDIAEIKTLTPNTLMSNEENNTAELKIEATNSNKKSIVLTSKDFLTFEPEKNYIINVFYKTIGTNTKADIVLNTSSGSDSILRSENKNDTSWELNSNDKWSKATFILKNGLSKLKYNVSVSLGKYNNDNKSDSTSPIEGTILVSHIEVSTISDKSFEANSLSAQILDTDDFEIGKFKKDSKYLEPETWSLSAENKNGESGILNISEENKELIVKSNEESTEEHPRLKLLTEEEFNKLKGLGNALVLNATDSNKIVASKEFTLEKNSYYKITVNVFANTNSAFATVDGSSGEYSYGKGNIKTEKPISDLTLNEYKPYTFLLKVDEKAENNKISIKLGLSDKGIAIFDKVKVQKLSNDSEYKLALTNGDKNVIELEAKRESAPSTTDKNKKPESDKQKVNKKMVFLYASAGIISALLVIVIIIYIYKNYIAKNKKQKFSKAKNKNNNKKKKSSRDRFEN